MALLLSILSLGPATGCRPSAPREDSELVPELKLEGVRFRVYRDASLRASGKAAVATYRRDNAVVTARDLASVLQTSEGEPVEVSAPRGGGDVTQRTFWADGGVVATRGQDRMTTARASYAPAPGGGEGELTGDQPVVVEGPGYRLDGRGFVYDPRTANIVVRNGARLVTTRNRGAK